MNKTREEQQLLRQLLLPIQLAKESKCEEVCINFFERNGIAKYEQRAWLSLQLGKWEDSENFIPPDTLRTLIDELLGIGTDGAKVSLKGCYFQCYKNLRTEYFFTHLEARAFLSHALLILELARTEHLSAAQIAKLLCQRDIRVKFSRQNVSDFLSVLKIAPSISSEDVQVITNQDILESVESFSDADVEASAIFVGEKAMALGCENNIYQDLSILFSIDFRNKYIPYIQILHYQCCVAEYYDHAITDLYEFSPRGIAATGLFARYPSNLVSAGNPFLNNAKGVEQVSSSWVRSRKTAEQRAGAAALLNILTSLEAMGFAARRELCRYLRLWVWRIMQLAQPALGALPKKLGLNDWNRILSHISCGNTETFGVLEQRLVDAIAVSKYPESNGWRSKGLSSSVNTTNTSQKKLGDCDFQHPTKHVLVALEAHGGMLSRIYVEEHLRTLKKIVPIRLNELLGISDIKNWSATIYYVAHSLSRDLSEYVMTINDLKINTKYILYKDFIHASQQEKNMEAIYNKYILDILNTNRTPQKVRDVVLSILNMK